jgi:hypothetical protein
MPWMFEANAGQFDAQTQFLARGPAYDVALSATQAQFLFSSAPPSSSNPTATTAANAAPASSVVSMQLVGANPNATASGVNELQTKTNYFIGSGQPITNVPNYGSVQFANVYNGIDVSYYGNAQNNLEHNYLVAPGADPSQIVTRISGADRVSLNAQGDLVIQTAMGSLVENAPVAYQDVNGTQQAVSSHFVLLGSNEVGIAVGAYDHGSPLIIDPNWVYSSYLGGTGNDVGRSIAVDTAGNAYVTGYTNQSFGGGLTFGKAGGNDVFVAEVASGGQQFVYVNYLAGSGDDRGQGIAVDTAGNAYVTGYTTSTNFFTKNAWQNANAGGEDAFVAEIKGGGSVAFSTYLGGTGDEQGNSIVVDPTSAQNIDVAGFTTSSNFGNSDNQWNRGPRGGQDAFVAQLTNGGQVNTILFMGGSADDSATGVDVGQRGNAYITGWTQKPSDNKSFFPTTAGAFQTTNAGSTDAFVAKVSWAAPGANPTLSYSTLFGSAGGGSSTEGNGIVLNGADDSVYIVGKTNSKAAFGVANKLNPTVLGSAGVAYNAFVTYFDPKGNPNVAAPYFVFLTGQQGSFGHGIALTTKVGAGGGVKLYITGDTPSNNLAPPGGNGFPTPGTLQPFRGNRQHEFDAFLALLDPTKAPANSLLWNTYIGGTGDDGGNGVAVDGSGYAYVTGDTQSLNFRPPGKPPVPGFQAAYGGGNTDAFVVEIAPNLAAAAAPQLAPLNNPLAPVDTLLSFTASAETFDNSSPYFSLSGAPSGASIDPNSGLFTWTPAPSQVGTWTFAIDASDAENDFAEQTITVSVIPQSSYLSVSSSASPSQSGQPVTFTATVIPEGGSGNPLPTGSVAFMDGTTLLNTTSLAVVNGSDQASFTTSALSSGSHDIVAIYGGDSVYGDSSGSAAQIVGSPSGGSTNTQVTSSLGQSTYGQAVTFTATVSGGNGTPTGSVVFEDGTTVLGSAPLALVGNSYQATLTTSTLAWGNHAVTAVYSGDSNNAGSSNSIDLSVLQGSTSTTLVSSANPVPYGQAVTFTATVVPTVGTGTPTGTITFINVNDGSEVGTATLVGGNGSAQATLTTSALEYGDQTIYASYSGDNNFSGSGSAPLDQWIS